MRFTVDDLLAAFRSGLDIEHGASSARGGGLAADLRYAFPTFRPRVVFDVGANIGQTAIRFSEDFPAATIYCFEPVMRAYEELKLNIERGTLRNVEAYQCALGEDNRPSQPIYAPKETALSSFMVLEGTPELVQMLTIDYFCASKNIARIDLLKIDTEGYDLAVLQGAARMLSERRVAFIQVEAALDDSDARFVAFDRFQPMQSLYGFEPFGIYDQMPHLDGRNSLGYFNAVFVQSEMLK